MRDKAVTYARQSQARADGSEASTETQRQKCHDLARMRDWDVVEDFADIGRSGYREGVDRPGLDAAIEAIRKGEATHLIVFKLDRLTRRGVVEAVRLVNEIIAAGGTLASAQEQFLDTSTALGRGIFGLIAALAEQESENISIRSSGAKATLRAAGSAAGGRTVFGMRSEAVQRDGLTLRMLSPDRDEAPILREIVAQVLDGVPVRSIVADLNTRGVTTKRGAEWSQSTLSRVLRSPAIGGYMPKHRVKDEGLQVRDGRIEIERDPESGELVHPWDGVLTPDEFHRLQDALDARAKPRGAATRVSLFGGFLMRCAECGGRMSADYRTDTNGNYRCTQHRRKSTKCKAGAAVSIRHAEDYVAAAVFRRLALLDPESSNDAALLVEATTRYAAQQTADNGRAAELRQSIASLTAALDRLDDDRAAGVFMGEAGDARYRRQAVTLATRLDAATADLQKITAEATPPIPFLDPANLGEDGPLGEGGFWQTMTLEDRRGFLGLFLDAVEAKKATRHAGGNAPFRGRERLRLIWAGEDGPRH